MGWLLTETQIDSESVITLEELKNAIVLLTYSSLPVHNLLGEKLSKYMSGYNHEQKESATKQVQNL